MNRASTRSAHRFSMSIAKARPCNPAKGLRQPLIIARQPAKACHRFDWLSASAGSAHRAPPGEASLNDPAARQRRHERVEAQHEAAFGFRPFNDLQPDAVGVGVSRRLFPRIALVDERHASTLRPAQRKQAQAPLRLTRR